MLDIVLSSCALLTVALYSCHIIPRCAPCHTQSREPSPARIGPGAWRVEGGRAFVYEMCSSHAAHLHPRA